MPDNPTVTVRARQSAASKKATMAKLQSKKRRTKTIEIEVDGEKMEMTFAAISAHDLDALQGKHTPTVEQRARGMVFNIDTMAPALVAACLVDPEMTEEEAKEIWTSEAWSTGELNYLFQTASDLCMQGLNIPFSGNG